MRGQEDVVLTQILSTLTVIKEDVRQTVLCLHGGKDSDGAHVPGLVDEFDTLRARVSALEGQAASHGQKVWAVILALLTAVLGWICSRIGSNR